MRYAAVLVAHAAAMGAAFTLGERAMEAALWAWSLLAVGAGLLVLFRAPGRWRPAQATLAPFAVIFAAGVMWWVPGVYAFIALALTLAVSLVVAVLYWLTVVVRWAARASRGRPSPAGRAPAATAAR
jgi:hypothetical protein